MRILTLTSLFILSTLALTGCASTDSDTSRDSITVSGQGEISAEPDTFRVIATARENGDDIAAMKTIVDERVGDMLALADKLNVEKNQVTALSMRVAPRWQHKPERKLLGHQVSRNVTFRVTGLDVYAQLLEGLAQQNLHNIRPAGSEVSQADALSEQAMEAAVADAQQRAKVLAEAAGRNLGKARQIEGQQLNRPQPVMRMAAQDASTKNYRPGESQITARVTITFELE